MRISIDFETRSRIDLGDCGAYRYSEHKDTEALVIAVREGLPSENRPVLTWDIRRDHRTSDAFALMTRAIREGWEIHAFNSQFEWTVFKYVLPRQFPGVPVPKIEQMRCTAAVCRTAGLPPSLARAAEFLKLPVQKDKTGKSLIRLFSIPRADGTFLSPVSGETVTVDGTKMTAAEAFDLFVEYCAQDVRTEVEIAKVMKPFELKGFMLDCFLADARMNDRGVPVNRAALLNAMRLYEEHESSLSKSFEEITGLSPSQNVAFLAWMKDRGYPGDSIDAKTRERHGNSEDLTDEARDAMRIKAELSFAAVKKIPAILNWLMDDDHVRGSFLWFGAQKTGRWTSKGPQWQNMKKPPKWLRPITEEVFSALERGMDLELFDFSYGNPYEVIASMARYFVRFPDDMIYDLDFAGVESRILPMLIGADRIMEKFHRGEDIYVSIAEALSLAFNKTIDRDMGKTITLATQFQGGWHAVYTATGETWNRPDCEKAVATIRRENPEFAPAWRAFQDAFVEALDNPDRWHEATRYVRFHYSEEGPFPRMLMRLASGRDITYPLPEKSPITMCRVERLVKDGKGRKEWKHLRWERVPGHRDLEETDYLIVEDPASERVAKVFHTWELSFYGHVKDGRYGRVKTYGGDLLQSATQGTGVDLLANGLITAERNGFEPFFAVHDQALAPARGDKDLFVRSMCDVPEWFEGFPLEAEADIVRSYCKQ